VLFEKATVRLRRNIAVYELHMDIMDINDPRFARAMAERLDQDARAYVTQCRESGGQA
jgi:hypothetical protein